MECKYYKFWNHSPKCPRSPDYYIKITSQFSFLWIFRSFCNHSSQSLHNNNLDIFVFAIFGKFWEFCRPNVRKLRGYSVCEIFGESKIADFDYGIHCDLVIFGHWVLKIHQTFRKLRKRKFRGYCYVVIGANDCKNAEKFKKPKIVRLFVCNDWVYAHGNKIYT